MEITTSQLITASAGAGAFDFGVRIANRLGAGVAWGNSVSFELRPAAGLNVKCDLRCSGSGDSNGCGGGDAGVHVFAVQLVEGAGGADEVPRQLVAVLRRTDGSAEEAAVQLTYIPQAVVRANGQQVTKLAARLAALREEASAADRARKKWEKDCAEARRAVQNEQAAVNLAPGLTVVEQAEAVRLQQEQQDQLAAPPTTPECRNPLPQLVLLKRERADLLCVYELGRVERHGDGEAIAALVGLRMMAVVTSTEAEKEQLIRDPRYTIVQR
jgi:hypothetical protein